MHHDQRHWTDAEVFRPERWAESGERGPYVPFGAGPYTCTGASVALTLMTETPEGPGRTLTAIFGE